jgi:hypothetical protein
MRVEVSFEKILKLLELPEKKWINDVVLHYRDRKLVLVIEDVSKWQ